MHRLDRRIRTALQDRAPEPAENSLLDRKEARFGGQEIAGGSNPLGWGLEWMHFSRSGLVQDTRLGMHSSPGWGRRQTGVVERERMG